MNSRPFSDFPCNEQGLVDNFIGTAYDVVKGVHDNLGELKRIDGVLDTIKDVAQDTADAAVADAMVGLNQTILEAKTDIDASVDKADESANLSEIAHQDTVTINQQLRSDFSGANAASNVGYGDTTVAAELGSLNIKSTALTNSLTQTDSNVAAIAETTAKASIYPSQRFGAINGGQLNKLRTALTNPFQQFLGICLVGDSITWGMTASGIAPILPRNGSLLDSRNNGSSPTWVNLLHKWLGSEYYNNSPVVESIWPGTSNGVAQFTYTDSVDIFPGFSPFTQVGSFSQLVDTSASLGVFWYVNMSSSGSGPHSFTWTMSGNSFDLLFAATPEGAEYQVFVDGVQQGDKYKTSSIDMGLSGPSYRQSRTHNFTFKKDAVIRIQAVGGDVSRDTLRIEGIRINRKLRVTNQGIIGIASERYRTILLPDALRIDDSFCFIQLGTNDRGMPPAINSPTSISSLTRNISLMIDDLNNKGVDTVLFCANEVINNSLPTYYYSMGEVRAALSSLASSRGVDFIDQYSPTSILRKAGISYLDDETHPNDFGHITMFYNARNWIESPVIIPAKQIIEKDVVTVSGQFTITKFVNGIMEVSGYAGLSPVIPANSNYNGSINLPVNFLNTANTLVGLNVVPTNSFEFSPPIMYMDNSDTSLVQYIIKNGATAQAFNLRLSVRGRWKAAT